MIDGYALTLRSLAYLWFSGFRLCSVHLFLLISDLIRSDQIRSEKMSSDQIRSEKINSDQIRSDQIRSDQTRPDQISSDHIMLIFKNSLLLNIFHYILIKIIIIEY